MLRRHFGKLLVALALLALGLGVEGFLRMDPATTPATAFYRAVQLFYWNYFPWNLTAEATLPWTLELARWLAPIATLGALSRVAITLFQRHWDDYRASRSRGHVVICGAGEKGAVLARELQARGTRVVLVEQDAGRVEALTGEGALVVQGDAGDAGVLCRSAAARAAKVVAATGNDYDNLAIALAASRAGATTIHAPAGSAALCDLYQRHSALTSPGNSPCEVRIFNTFRNMARCTLREFPPTPAEGEVHVVLPDLGDPALALAVEYAFMGHFPGDGRVHLHLASTDAERECDLLRARFPAMDRCLQLTALPLAAPELFSPRVAALVNASAAASFTIFPSLTDGNLGFSRTLEMLEFTRNDRTVRLLLPAPETSPLRAVVERNPAVRAWVGFLPTREMACGHEAVLGESLDRTARTIHENWLRETNTQIAAARAAGDEPLARRHEAKATFRPWDHLSEEQKGASRSQADHIPYKIRAAGLDPATVTPGQWTQLSEAHIETLARLEHARWAAYYWMSGWTFAAERDDDRKEHPNLTGYDDLDEPTKEYDRAAVRNLAQFLPTWSAGK